MSKNIFSKPLDPRKRTLPNKTKIETHSVPIGVMYGDISAKSMKDALEKIPAEVDLNSVSFNQNRFIWSKEVPNPQYDKAVESYNEAIIQYEIDLKAYEEFQKKIEARDKGAIKLEIERLEQRLLAKKEELRLKEQE